MLTPFVCAHMAIGDRPGGKGNFAAGMDWCARSNCSQTHKLRLFVTVENLDRMAWLVDCRALAVTHRSSIEKGTRRPFLRNAACRPLKAAGFGLKRRVAEDGEKLRSPLSRPIVIEIGLHRDSDEVFVTRR